MVKFKKFFGSIYGCAAFGFFLLFWIGCYLPEVERAFSGRYATEENNRIINDYCQTCHIHRNFIPGPHVQEVAQTYKKKEFQDASECSKCHYLVKLWIRSDYERKTIRPAEADEE